MSATAGSQGGLQRKVCGGCAQCSWASCDAMEGPGPPRGYRARWRNRGNASEGSAPELDSGGADSWEQAGLAFSDASEAGELQTDEAEAAGQRRLDQINEDLQRAVDHVTPEEIETYWSALPPEVRELVSVGGEVSADLLSYIADTDEDRMEILRQSGCPESEVAEKAVVKRRLQG